VHFEGHADALIAHAALRAEIEAIAGRVKCRSGDLRTIMAFQLEKRRPGTAGWANTFRQNAAPSVTPQNPAAVQARNWRRFSMPPRP
jgi:hypothetical protein